MRVLLVEDDPILSNRIARALNEHEILVDILDNGLEADAVLQQSEISLLVLDIGLPGIDGFEVMRRLRQRGSNVPVLMLTARDAIHDRVHGLEKGADDYLIKPFATIELAARIKALIRRSTPKPTELKIAGLTLNTLSKCVYVNGVPIGLSVREWHVLEHLLHHPGRVISKQQIITAILPSGEDVTQNAVEVYISRIRMKIADAGITIRTIRGFGYLLEKNK